MSAAYRVHVVADNGNKVARPFVHTERANYPQQAAGIAALRFMTTLVESGGVAWDRMTMRTHETDESRVVVELLEELADGTTQTQTLEVVAREVI